MHCWYRTRFGIAKATASGWQCPGRPLIQKWREVRQTGNVFTLPSPASSSPSTPLKQVAVWRGWATVCCSQWATMVRMGAEPRRFPQTPSSDYGKVLLLDMQGGAEVFTLGHRNPQGLLVDSSDRIWATEHGPAGGDEINLLREGA